MPPYALPSSQASALLQTFESFVEKNLHWLIMTLKRDQDDIPIMIFDEAARHMESVSIQRHPPMIIDTS